jgi:hypothetical protein
MSNGIFKKLEERILNVFTTKKWICLTWFEHYARYTCVKILLRTSSKCIFYVFMYQLKHKFSLKIIWLLKWVDLLFLSDTSLCFQLIVFISIDAAIKSRILHNSVPCLCTTKWLKQPRDVMTASHHISPRYEMWWPHHITSHPDMITSRFRVWPGFRNLVLLCTTTWWQLLYIAGEKLLGSRKMSFWNQILTKIHDYIWVEVHKSVCISEGNVKSIMGTKQTRVDTPR